MKSTTLRLLGVLMALMLAAAACGGGTEATAEATNEDAATDDTAMDDTAMDDTADEDHSDDDHEHSHDHSAVEEVDPSLPIPGVEIELTESDVAGTFVVNVTLENFTITEENVDADPIDNEGHMHLYVDGERITRFFDLEHVVTIYEGEHLVEVELSANNHSPYAIDGEAIRAGATATGTGEAPAVVELDASDATTVLSASYVDGTVTLDGDERIEVAEGDVVMLTVTSDVEEEVHVHGADLFATVGPDEDAMMIFEVTNAGRFEIEFEESGQFIAELVVSS